MELGERRPDIVCTATSVQTHDLALSLGLRVVSPDEIGHLDVAIDGADEVDPSFNLTKGGGNAHTREKIIASMADRFIVVVDETKLVDRLGPFGTPDRGARLRPRGGRRSVQALGAGEIVTRARPQRQREHGDDRPLRPHRRPGGAGGRAGRGARASSSTASSPARWSSGWWWRTATASASWSTTRPDPRSVGEAQPRPRYWARGPTASLLSRFERCRPSSTNSTALATIAGESSPAHEGQHRLTHRGQRRSAGRRSRTR